MSDPAKTEQKQRQGRWRPGESGNPAGRPEGSRHKTTLAIQAMLDGEAEGLTRKAIDLALDGDTTALRLCIERLAPAPKERRVSLDLPDVAGPEAIASTLAAVLTAVSAGEITPGEGAAIAALVEKWRAAVETEDLAKRIVALEERVSK